MPPQQQAERLLERAVTRYKGALVQLSKRLPAWESTIEHSPRLHSLVGLALNSSDLTLVSNRIARDADTVRALSARLKSEKDSRPWLLWILALLANRGVEPDASRLLILDYTHNANEEIRLQLSRIGYAHPPATRPGHPWPISDDG